MSRPDMFSQQVLMPTRRRFVSLSVLTLGAALALPGRAAFAQAAAAAQGGAVDTAVQFVRQTGEKLLAIVNSPASLPDKQKQLTPIINQAVDVDAIARFCLGRFWRQANPEQQKSYLQLFHAVLVNSITGKLGDYPGVTFTVGHARASDEGVIVSTTITRPNNPPTAVDWLISTETGSPKIADMIAEGTSLRLTQRSDYASYLSHNNNDVQALIDAMRRQLAG